MQTTERVYRFVLLGLLILVPCRVQGASNQPQDSTSLSLPKVLLIGDSISIGYTPHVVQALNGRAEVTHHPGNARHTGNGLKLLDEWLGDTAWDVISFNWGLHDLCYRNPDAQNSGNRDKVHGTLQTTLEQYEHNLEVLVQRLKATGAHLIWCNTTTVPEGEPGRFAGDEHRYNAVAAAIMQRHGIPINDLNAVTSAMGPEFYRAAADVHLTAEGSQLLGSAVAREILRGVSQQTAAAGDQPGDMQCDLLVYGSTPGGVACAVRAAREGLNVILVTHADHLGGLLTSGLSTMDTLYNGPRAPVYDELRAAIHGHYRNVDGEDSENYKRSMPGQAKTKFEARVVERLIGDLLNREPRIRVVRGFYPVAATINHRLIRDVTFQQMTGAHRFTVGSATFADCSYEADLAVTAQVPCRTGRESREMFQEKHAGQIYMKPIPWPPAHVDPQYLAEYRRMNLVHYNSWFEEIPTPESGTADPAVQAFNLRTVLTNNPVNRLPVTKPAEYDRDLLLNDLKTRVNWSTRIPGTKLPNQKTYWNLPELLGVQSAYAEGDWTARQQVRDAHASLTLALLYFLQNDPSVPEDVRSQWKEWGLPLDEFPDNAHLPYEIYMRETRRMIGRSVFIEQDALPTAGSKRSPIHSDSVGITEWFLDSHACTPKKIEDSDWEGEVLLKNVTVPGQVSWRTMLPADLNNLVVPVCLSSSHIGWGAIRLEPTWMALGESAAWAAVMAKSQEVAVAEVSVPRLMRQLADQRILLTFFNDIEHSKDTDWYSAVQYLGTQGYFGSHDAAPERPLLRPLAQQWSKHTVSLIRREVSDSTAAACDNWKAEQEAGPEVTASEFATMLDEAGRTTRFTAQLPLLKIDPDSVLSRADACRLLYAVLPLMEH
jgi:hypothetical protein